MPRWMRDRLALASKASRYATEAGPISRELKEIEERIKEARDEAIEKLSSFEQATMAYLKMKLEHVDGIVEQAITRQLDRVAERLQWAVRKQSDEDWYELAVMTRKFLEEFAGKATERPLLERLIAYRDRMLSEQTFLVASYQRDAGLSAHLGCRQVFEQHQAALAALDQELLDILRGAGVVPLRGVGGPFDPQRQRVVGVEPTSDKRRDGHVAKIVRCGYSWHGTVIRAEEVVIVKFKEGS